MAPAAAVAFPMTPAGEQASWLQTAMAHPPIPVAQIEAHFDSAFLDQVPAAEVSSESAEIGPLRLVSVTTSQASGIVFLASASAAKEYRVTLVVDGQGLIAGLTFVNVVVGTGPTTWAGVDAAVRSAAPDAHLLVSRLSGRRGSCQPVHAISPATPAPLGSAFKLYVLDALAADIAAGKVNWGQMITITNQVKSLPSGVLQNEPAGTKLSVLDVAAQMISISDNTAADMLIGLVGRAAVEAAIRNAGMADPSLDTPFLTTREMFVLKLHDWPLLANSYLALRTSGERDAFIAKYVDTVPRSSLLAPAALWGTPRDVNSIEWFASAQDMCRAYASLLTYSERPGLSDLAKVLEINDGGLGLSPGQWKYTWFKGGSEPGVLTLDYLATTVSGQTYVVSVLVMDTYGTISNATTFSLLSAIKGAFELAARS
jgi:hypothetical protein